MPNLQQSNKGTRIWPNDSTTAHLKKRTSHYRNTSQKSLRYLSNCSKKFTGTGENDSFE